jgi:hypothetical protein
VTGARFVVCLLIVLVVVVPAARFASGGPPDARGHASIKHASRTPPNTLRQGTLADQPAMPVLGIERRVVVLDGDVHARVVVDPPFVPPRG